MDTSGYTRNGYSIMVMHMPYRKKPCLAVKYPDENAYYKVASFNNEESAEIFIKQLGELLGVKE